MPGAITFTQVFSSMYDELFGITPNTSGYSYFITKLVPLILGCTKAPYAKNITGTFTPDALSTRKNVIKKLDSLQFFS